MHRTCGYIGTNPATSKDKAHALAFGENGGFGPPQVYPDTSTNSGCASVVAADFNGDGHMDLALGGWHHDDLTIILGKGNGTFSAPVNYSAAYGRSHLLVGDLNGDGKPDILILEGLQTAINKGNGTFKIIASGI